MPLTNYQIERTTFARQKLTRLWRMDSETRGEIISGPVDHADWMPYGAFEAGSDNEAIDLYRRLVGHY